MFGGCFLDAGSPKFKLGQNKLEKKVSENVSMKYYLTHLTHLSWFVHFDRLDYTARKIRFTHIYSCANMMRTGCKCVANMVNAVFTTHLHGGCKCMSKYGIYKVCHTFAPRLHHICS